MDFFGKLGQEPDSLTCYRTLSNLQSSLNLIGALKKKKDFGANKLYHSVVLLLSYVIIMISLQIC